MTIRQCVTYRNDLRGTLTSRSNNGIPGVSAKTLKKREWEIQKPLADLATTSCHQAVQEEIEKTRDNGGPIVTKNAAVIDKTVQYFT
jgi:hypothetical protein